MDGRTTAALLVTTAVLALVPAGSVAHPGGVTLSGRGTATVDGAVSTGEWVGAGTLPFQANVPGGGTVPATLRVMNDDANLYFSLVVARVGGQQTVSFGFDNDHDASTSPEEGDDGLSFGFGVGGPGLNDNVRSSQPPCPAGSFCAFRDTDPGGTIDGSAAVATIGAETHFELSHPLDSADNLNDFSLGFGATVGFGFQYVVDGIFTVPASFSPMLSDILVRPPDTFAPDTSITSGIADGAVTDATTARFGFSGTDDVAPPAALSYECSLDDAPFTPCASEREYSGLAAGSHVFAVRARDPAGNTDPSPALRRWVIQAAPPPPPAGGGGGAADASVSIETTATSLKPGQAIEIRVTVANKALVVGATGLRLVITLPPGVSLLGPPAFDRGSGCVGTTTLDCFLDYLPGTTSTVVRFSIGVGAAGSKEITAVATTNVPDSDEANNRAGLTLVVAQPPAAPPTVATGVVRIGTAVADVLRGTPGPDQLSGRGGNDRLFGLGGSDRLFGGPGSDLLDGGGDRDVLEAGAGGDILATRDGAIDVVRCGTGRDRVTADRADRVGADCELVSRR